MVCADVLGRIFRRRAKPTGVTRSRKHVARAKRLFALHRALEPVARQCVAVLLFLTFYERPWWCAGRHKYRCRAPELYPRAAVPLMSPAASFWLGVLPLGPLLALSVVDLRVEAALPTATPTLRDVLTSSAYHRALCATALAGVKVGQKVAADKNAVLLAASPLLCACVALTNFPQVRRQILLVLRAVPAVGNVLVLLAFVIALFVCRADIPPMNRGDAAAGTWIFRGVAAPPRLPREYSSGESRRRRDWDVDVPRGRGDGTAAT